MLEATAKEALALNKGYIGTEEQGLHRHGKFATGTYTAACGFSCHPGAGDLQPHPGDDPAHAPAQVASCGLRL